jgi:hypothetical protein
MGENSAKIAALQSSQGNNPGMGTDVELDKLVALNRTLQNDRIAQQHYLDLMHAYLMVEIAWWRRVRYLEIRNCVRSYAIEMKRVCEDRVSMWAHVEHGIGEQLFQLTGNKPFESRR